MQLLIIAVACCILLDVAMVQRLLVQLHDPADTATQQSYLRVDGDMSVLWEARVLVEGPKLLQSIQVSLLKVLQTCLPQ